MRITLWRTRFSRFVARENASTVTVTLHATQFRTHSPGIRNVRRHRAWNQTLPLRSRATVRTPTKPALESADTRFPGIAGTFSHLFPNFPAAGSPAVAGNITRAEGEAMDPSKRETGSFILRVGFNYRAVKLATRFHLKTLIHHEARFAPPPRSDFSPGRRSASIAKSRIKIREER